MTNVKRGRPEYEEESLGSEAWEQELPEGKELSVQINEEGGTAKTAGGRVVRRAKRDGETREKSMKKGGLRSQ